MSTITPVPDANQSPVDGEAANVTLNTTALDQWNTRADADNSIDLNELLGAVAAGKSWVDRDCDLISHVPSLCGVSSMPVSVPLTHHVGSASRALRDLSPANADVRIMQRIKSSEPFVSLQCWEAKSGKGFDPVAGSRYTLTLDEAVHLAHTLLLAVDVARGTSDDIGQVSA